MKAQSIFFKVSIVVLLLCIVSCAKEDLIKEDTMVFPSKIKSEFMMLSVSRGAFTSDSSVTPHLMITDSLPFTNQISEDSKRGLVKSQLTFIIENNIKADLKMTLKFLNAQNDVQYILHIPISAGAKKHSSFVETNVQIENVELAQFKQATRIVYTITSTSSDPSVLEETSGIFSCQANSTAYFE